MNEVTMNTRIKYEDIANEAVISLLEKKLCYKDSRLCEIKNTKKCSRRKKSK